MSTGDFNDRPDLQLHDSFMSTQSTYQLSQYRGLRILISHDARPDQARRADHLTASGEDTWAWKTRTIYCHQAWDLQR